MKRTWLLLAGAVILSGCMHEAAQVRLNPDYFLGYDDKGRTAALVYGLPDSDDLALMLECPKGSGRVQLSDMVRDRQATVVALTSGGHRTEVPVRVESGPDGELIAGELPLSASALQGFRRSGVLNVANGTARYTITVPADRRASVEKFFEVCG